MASRAAILLFFAALSILYERALPAAYNKAVKIIKTDVGQVFDCVNIYEQPALDHPLLKNHKIQLKPTYVPKEYSIENSLKPKSNFSEIKVKKIGCPSGTVPILRASNNIRKTPRLLSQRPGTDRPYSPGHHIIAAKTHKRVKTRYHGSKTYITVYTPNVSPNQFSEGAMWVNSGPVDKPNSIQVGWTVHPALYGDNHTHLFGYWTADGFDQTGCYDTRCAGFVQINPDTSLGLILEPTSHGREQYKGLFHIFQDRKTGNWWLAILPDDLLIGYWPKRIFTSLAGHANQIMWGGKTYSPLNEIAPPMGSGQFSIKDTEATCFACDIQIIDGFYKYKDLKGIAIDIEGYNYKPCYAIGYSGYRKYLGYSVLFGGPGGFNCSQ